MKKLRILISILVHTKADKMLLSFLLFWLVAALLIQLFEPGITSYGDALWYCYAVITTIGFGDVVVTTLFAKVISIILSIYAVIIIGIVTGVIVNYYNQIIQIQQQETIVSIIDKLEHLPNMSQEELKELSHKVKSFKEAK